MDLGNSLRTAQTVTSVLVNLSVLAGAVVALIKFRVLHMFSRRYRSELQCKHYVLPTGRVIFEADCTIYNSGERPIAISSVTMRLYPTAAIRRRTSGCMCRWRPMPAPGPASDYAYVPSFGPRVSFAICRMAPRW